MGKLHNFTQEELDAAHTKLTSEASEAIEYDQEASNADYILQDAINELVELRAKMQALQDLGEKLKTQDCKFYDGGDMNYTVYTFSRTEDGLYQVNDGEDIAWHTPHTFANISDALVFYVELAGRFYKKKG